MKQWLRHLALSLLLLAAAAAVFLYWLSPSQQEQVTAAMVYTEPAAYAVQYDAAAAALTEQGLVTTAKQVEDWQKEAIRAIAHGATLVVVGADTLPQDDALLRYAEQSSATLFFVGTYPGDEYLSSYDKAYYVGSRISYAGEVTGYQLAEHFSSGQIPDKNENKILEYLIATEYPNFPLFHNTLRECEHYGVYVQNCLPVVEAPEEDAEDSALPEAAPLLWTDCTTPPEVILCGSLPDLEKAVAWTAERGWPDVSYAAFVSSTDRAEQALALGCRIIVYYDIQSVTDALQTMLWNQAQHSALVQDLDYSPDVYGAVWVPYRLYDVPPLPAPTPETTPAPEADPAAEATPAPDATANP